MTAIGLKNGVAPLAGAWIETLRWAVVKVIMRSRPSRARGLKRPLPRKQKNGRKSRPSRARGLKLENVEGVINRLCRAPRGRVD